jgi:predicted methyltransferase
MLGAAGARPASPNFDEGSTMRTPIRFALAFSAVLLGGALPACLPAYAAEQPAASSYRAAIASPIRLDADRKTDAKRKPAEFLAFARVTPGMKALDISSGGGSTAALLAAAVGSKGEVWAQNAKPNPKLQERLGEAAVPNLHAVVTDFGNPVPQGTPPLDLITINMSYHDIANTPADRAAMNKRLYEALKPGGTLVIIDNAAKKGSGLSATKTLHRIDEDTVVDEITKAGFKVDARSDYLHVASDPREQPFFKMESPDDKFAVRFKK